MKTYQLLTAASLFFAMVSTATAVDRYVLPTGTNGPNDCTDSSNPCRTVRHAASESAPNDVIVLMEAIAGGTTTFPISNGSIINHDLVFRGEGTGPENTILDATGSADRHFTIQNAGLVRFENMTLTGGEPADDGGAIDLTGGGTLELDRTIFRDNESPTSGGAIGLDGTLNADDTTFENNTALGTSGGAVRVRSGSAQFTNSAFTGNTAPDDGGAVYVEDGTAEFEGVEMSENHATYGGAIACRININDGTGCTYLRVDKESLFTRNSADQDGGAIFTQADSLIQESDFKGNETSSTTSLADGGAIYANIGIDDDNSRLLVKQCEFVNNSSGGNGGAIGSNYSDVRIRRSTFRRNTAGTNGAGNGGAVSFSEPSQRAGLTMINSTISKNEATYSAGAINIVGGLDNQLLSLTLVDNFSSSSVCQTCADDINGAGEMSRVLIDHPNLGNSGSECSSPLFTGFYNLIQSNSCGSAADFLESGNAGDLDFGDWGGRTRTYKITSGSAAFGAGQQCSKFDGSDLLIDQRGQPRTAGACDIGSFERQ